MIDFVEKRVVRGLIDRDERFGDGRRAAAFQIEKQAHHPIACGGHRFFGKNLSAPHTTVEFRKRNPACVVLLFRTAVFLRQRDEVILRFLRELFLEKNERAAAEEILRDLLFAVSDAEQDPLRAVTRGKLLRRGNRGQAQRIGFRFREHRIGDQFNGLANVQFVFAARRV